MDYKRTMVLDKINYKEIFDCIINDAIYYEDLVQGDSQYRNLLENEFYKQCDEAILRNFNKAVSEGVRGRLSEQSPNKDAFRHIFLNHTKQIEKIRYRLYLTPKDEVLFHLVNEICAQSIKNELPIYIKYNRKNRKDKLLFYLQDEEDYLKVVKMLFEIKTKHPEYFTNMGHMASLVSESEFPGAYLTFEKHLIGVNDREFNSYNTLFCSILNEIEDLMKFSCKSSKEDKKKFKELDQEYLFNEIFKPICLRTLLKYGVILYYDNGLQHIVNELTPELCKPLNEYIGTNNDGLVIGLRQKNNLFRFFYIPYGKKIPNNNELYQYQYEDMNFNEYLLRDLYPSPYKNKK